MKQYRVRQINNRFYPQRKWWFGIWIDLWEYNVSGSPHYSTLEEAIDYIKSQEICDNPIVKIHEVKL